MASKSVASESGFFKTEISQAANDERTSFLYDKRGDSDKIASLKSQNEDHKRQKTPDRFKAEISTVHLRRTPTPSDGKRKQQDTNDTESTNFLKLLTMRNIARQVRTIQVNRQRRLDYTGNETIENKVRRFKPEEVEPVLFDFLKDNLQDLCYDPNECKELSKELSEELREVVKSMKFPRYKFVAMVTIGQKDKQTVTIGSRSVWNSDTDTYASVQYTNGSIFATAMVFAVFFE